MKFVGLVGIVIGEWRFLFRMLHCFVYFFTQKLVTVCIVLKAGALDLAAV